MNLIIIIQTIAILFGLTDFLTERYPRLQRDIYHIALFVVTFLFAIKYYYGPDIMSYVPFYETVPTLSSIWSNPDDLRFHFEPGFATFCRILKDCGLSFYWMTAVLTILYFMTIHLFLRRIESKRSFALAILVVLEYNVVCYELRQCLAIVFFFLILAGFAWFIVRGQLSKVAKARNKYQSVQNELNELAAVRSRYDGIEELYSHYGSSYMNADELALQNRMAILNVINNEISLAQGLSQIQLSGNTATVKLMSLELKEVSSIVAKLEESPIVSYVGVDTASMDEQGNLARRSGSLVQATLTIEFSARAGVDDGPQDSGETLTSQLAARKAAVEAMGEE